MRGNWGIVGVVLWVALLLLPKLHNEFVFDDVFVFLTSEVVHSLSNIPAIFSNNAMFVAGIDDTLIIDTYRPITLTSFALDSVWTGKDPFGYHVTNLLLHLFNVWLLHRVAKLILSESNGSLAWAAALLFGVSPWIGEAHIWINGRSDPMCTMFVLLSLLAWDRALQKQIPWMHFVSALCFFFALLSKEVALFVFPALLFWPAFSRASAPIGMRALRIGGFAIACVAYLGIRVAVLGGIRSHGSLDHLFNSGMNLGLLIWDGLRALIIPSPPFLRSLAETYFRFGVAVKCIALVSTVGLLVVSFLRRQTSPVWFWSILGYVLTIAPASLITELVWPGFGRYLYLPFAFLSVGLVEVVLNWFRKKAILTNETKRRFLTVVFGLYVAAMSILLLGFVRDFENDGTLYYAAMQAEPTHAHGFFGAGSALLHRTQADDAIEYLEKAFRMQPYEPKYRSAYALALIRVGENSKAVALAESWLVGSAPSSSASYLRLIGIGLAEEDPERSVAAVLACVRASVNASPCVKQLNDYYAKYGESSEYARELRRQLSAPANRAARELVPVPSM